MVDTGSALQSTTVSNRERERASTPMFVCERACVMINKYICNTVDGGCFHHHYINASLDHTKASEKN